MKRVFCFISVFLTMAFLLSACGGGGGGATGGAATALVVAEKVSVVDANAAGAEAGALRALGIDAAAVLADLPAGSDYLADKTQVWVSERSAESFGTINEILCSIAQSQYDDMLNRGDYTALVDQNLCKSDKDSASGSGQQNNTSGSAMPAYEKWTVNSSRPDNNSPETIKVWIHEEAREHESAGVIKGKMVITEGKSDTNPYGLFKVDFQKHEYYGSPAILNTTAKFRGYLESERDPSGKVLLKLFFHGDRPEEGGYEEEQIVLDKAESKGKVKIVQTGDYPKDEWFEIAFNDANFLRRDELGNSVCLDRNDFDTSAWRYGLYNTTTGSRLNRNSGFSIKTEAGKYGWVGYWGLWVDKDASVGSGDSVFKYDYQTGASQEYTVFQSAGKLQKHIRNELKLNEIKNIPLSLWEWDNNQYRVIWDGTDFVKTAITNQTDNWTWKNLPSPVAIDLSNIRYTDLNMWSESLHGSVQVKLDGCVYVPGPDNMDWMDDHNDCPAQNGAVTNVVTYAEEMVYPGDDTVPAGLACYDNCINATEAGVDPDNAYFPNNYDPSGSSRRDYTFDSGGLLLSYLGNAVVMDSTSAQNQWGVRSGSLFDPTPENLALLDCNWDGDGDPSSNPQTCAWKAWSVLPVYYTWETGPNNWNRFTALFDAGGFLQFEAPLAVEYVPSAGKYAGTKFMLQYNGFGELHGIPGKCVDMDDPGRENVDCSQGGRSIRWVPEFTIPAATGFNLTEVTAGGNQYFVKPLEMEQRMKADPTCSLTAADLPTDLVLPDDSGLADPGIGDEPAVDAAPAVIGGIVQ